MLKHRAFINIALISLYLTLTLYGIYQIKLAGFHELIFYVGFASYVASYGVWIVFMKLNPLSKAYAIAAGSLIIATQIIDYFVLNMPFASLQMIGITLIFIGILLIHQEARRISDKGVF